MASTLAQRAYQSSRRKSPGPSRRLPKTSSGICRSTCPTRPRRRRFAEPAPPPARSAPTATSSPVPRSRVVSSGQALHLGEHDRRPLGKVLHRVGLDRVLVHRITGPAADAQILYGLEERGSHGKTVQLGAQAIDDLSGAHVALRQWLERNVEVSVIGGPAAAGEGNHILDGRIVLDHAADLLNGIVHGREG